MARCEVGAENGAAIELHYEDHGSGRPVMLIHGYPLSGSAWEQQERALLAAGYRVIRYDRRGFGRSSQPTLGYDYDSFAADLNVLFEHLDLRDVNPEGVDGQVFEDMKAAVVKDRYAYFKDVLDDCPPLVVHGTEDRILPIAATADRLPGLIPGVRLIRVEGGPHNIGWTHSEQVNRALLEFLA